MFCWGYTRILSGFIWYIYQKSSGLLHWNWGNLKISPMSVNFGDSAGYGVMGRAAQSGGLRGLVKSALWIDKNSNQYLTDLIVCERFEQTTHINDATSSHIIVSGFYEFKPKCSGKQSAEQKLNCSPGARPTNDISIELEIRPKFAVLWLNTYSTDHNKILYTSRQCNCRDVCKILLWSVEHILN